MTSAADVTTKPQPPPAALPEFWPEQARTTPVRPVWIPWPVAIVLVPLLWLMPRRMGPHFAAVRWPGVVLAHLVWVVYGIGCIAVAFVNPQYGLTACILGSAPAADPVLMGSAHGPGEALADPPALLAILLAGHPYANFEGAISDSESLFLGLGLVAGVEAGLVLVACLLMPYVTVGERGMLLFRRCMKLTLWATTPLPVLGLVFQAIELLERDRRDLDILWGFATVLYIVWSVGFVIRSGLRYGGPPEGPAWRPRRPLCESCGYALTGLTAAHRCPECGRPVVDSLPTHRRRSPMAAATGLPSRLTSYLSTFAQVLFRRDFYDHLAVSHDRDAARRFAVWTGLTLLPVGWLVYRICLLLVEGWASLMRDLASPLSWGDVFIVICAWLCAPILLLAMLGGLVLLGTRFGWQPMHPLNIVMFYWSAWIVPMIVAAAIALAVYEAMDRARLLIGFFDFGPFGKHERVLILAPVPFVVVMAPVVLFSVLCLLRGSRQTQFANA